VIGIEVERCRPREMPLPLYSQPLRRLRRCPMTRDRLMSGSLLPVTFWKYTLTTDATSLNAEMTASFCGCVNTVQPLNAAKSKSAGCEAPAN
jgi:hypothetical protein